MVIRCHATSAQAGLRQPDPNLDGSWRQFRRDPSLSGRSPLIGNIDCPSHLWTYDLGLLSAFFTVRPGSGVSQAALPTAFFGDVQQALSDFAVAGDLLDLDGDGVGETLPTTGDYKIGDFLPGVPGLERVTCFDENIGLGDPVSCRLENFSGGAWQNVWTSDPIPEVEPGRVSVEEGRPIVGDFDNDGQDEVAVISWYEIYVLDLATGDLEQTGTFFSGRSGPDDTTTPRGYGFFGAFDVDGNGDLEFVILGDRERFISVIGWVDGRLEEIWERPIGDKTERRHVPLARPVQDVDGDGRLEIVTRIYNETGDGRWHTLVINAANGSAKLDLPGVYVEGLGDVNQDAIPELFLVDAPGQGVPEFGAVRIVALDGQNQETRWSAAAAGFITANLDFPPDHINTNVLLNGDRGHRRSVFLQPGYVAGNPVFAVRQPLAAPLSRIVLHQFRNGSGIELGTVTGPRLSLVAAHDAQPGILFRSVVSDAGEGPLAGTGVEIELRGASRFNEGDPAAGRSLKSGVAVSTATPRPQMIVQQFDEQLLALELRAGQPELVWERHGRGMADGRSFTGPVNLDEFASVLMANVTGDERLEVISVTTGEDGQAVVEALSRSGERLWASPFPVPGRAPTQEAAGITNWTAGNFRSQVHQDVLVHYRVTDSGQSVRLLDGATGTPVWQRDVAKMEGDLATGCRARSGGRHGPAFDWDGDGLDEYLDLPASAMAVYDGPDGGDLLSEWTSEFCPNPLPLFQQFDERLVLTAAVEIQPGGGRQVLYGKNPTTLALLALDGQTVWNTPLYDGMSMTSLQGLGDVNGDGTVDVVAVGRCDSNGTNATAYAGDSGDTLWNLTYLADCENRPTSVATGDINGDGRDEALFVSANILYAIGETSVGTPAVLWTAEIDPEFQNPQGQVQIADVLGNGRPQILVSVEDGFLVSLGNPVTLGQSDLAAGIRQCNRTVSVGETVRYSASVLNKGPDPALGVSLDITLPAGSTLVTAGAGNCSAEGELVSCYVRSLDAGEALSIDLEVVMPGGESSLTTMAVAITSTPESSQANNAVSAAVELVPNLVYVDAFEVCSG